MLSTHQPHRLTYGTIHAFSCDVSSTNFQVVGDALADILHAQFHTGVFRQISDAIMVADIVLESTTEASSDTRDFFTDAPSLLAEIFRAQPRMPAVMPLLDLPSDPRSAITQNVMAELMMSEELEQSNSRNVDEILRTNFSIGLWAELAITVGVTRKDLAGIDTRKAQQVCALLGFVADVMRELRRPRLYLAPLGPDNFRLIGEHAA